MGVDVEAGVARDLETGVGSASIFNFLAFLVGIEGVAVDSV